MSRSKKKNIKKIIAIIIIILLFMLSIVALLVHSLNKYIERRTKFHEKTTFTTQETEYLWSELGLEYIDLDISKAYYNNDNYLYVITEGFDSVDAEIKYLKQFYGNENVEEGAALEHNHKGDEVSELFDIKCTDKGSFRDCFTYEENGKYYLEFYKNGAVGHDLNEMFGFNK